MRILFITSTRIGDAVISTGLLDHLLKTYPNARFTVACGPVAAGIFTHMPRLDRLIVVAKQRFDLHWLILWAKLAGTRWDLTIDLRGSALTLLLFSRKRAIMRGGRRPGHRLNHLAGALNLAPPPLPTAWTSAEEQRRAATKLPAGAPVIGLGPTANWPDKIWPAENFIALARALERHLPGARIAVFGGPGATERQAAAPVIAALPAAIDLVGRQTLSEAAACLARCNIFVGNDSGLMHLAASAGTPTLGLFGPTPASEYAPAGRGTAGALADGPAADAAMTALPVTAALTAALALLTRAAESARPGTPPRNSAAAIPHPRRADRAG
jgi:ADP-heptose:LPS heptosyltransferase